MSDPFHAQIRKALSDPALQAALDANAERRHQGRQSALSSLPDYESLRRRAHRVRADTISHLDQHLETFVSRAQANGLQVHRAASAAQAVETVLKIARQAGARWVAKSKTMVSEEIGLNPALEAAGLRVVETDLGEYIVQLRGERPSHIITPAVHLRREEVGQTFHERLGVPLTDDIPTLIQIARRELRQVFLTAEVGVSGVNFGVAETGTLCIITNEGNGRMVTTLPPVHIALMGIERLVPTLDDLALMLTLLPRAATGQQATVYVNLIRGPRHPGEPDGPTQRHLVLVDNGRQAMRSSPLAEALLCIRCGACLNACPVFREIGGHAYVDASGLGSVYPGPIGSIVSPALFGQAAFGHLAHASTLCGACREACPVDIDLPGLLLRTRAGGVHPQDHTPRTIPRRLAWGLRLYTWLATSPARFTAAQRLAALLARVLAPGEGWLRMPPPTGWGQGRRFPRPALPSFRDQRRGRSSPSSQGQGDRRSRQPATEASEAPAPPADQEDGIPTAGEGDARLSSERSLVMEVAHQGRVARFAAELTTLGGGFTGCRKDDLVDQVLARLHLEQAQEVLAWEADHLPGGLAAALTSAGIELKHGDLPQGAFPNVGLTGALAGIAETGTLVLPAGVGRPLTASLVPQVHLALLHEDAILEDLAQALRLREVQEATSVALVSGPSRTADIEMTLTIGVHGPARVHVFCFRD